MKDGNLKMAASGSIPKKTSDPRYPNKRCGAYHTYTPEQKVLIGKYAAEHGNHKASEHFTKEFGIRIAESTVRTHKKAYYALLSEGKNSDEVKAIPYKQKGREKQRPIKRIKGSTIKSRRSPVAMCTLSEEDPLDHDKGLLADISMETNPSTVVGLCSFQVTLTQGARLHGSNNTPN